MALDAAPAVEFVGKLQARGVKSVLMGGQHMLSQVFWRLAGSRAEAFSVIAPVESLSRPEFRSTVDQLKQAGITQIAVSQAAEASWKQVSGISIRVADPQTAVKLPNPGVQYRANQAGATRSPWVDSNGRKRPHVLRSIERGATG